MTEPVAPGSLRPRWLICRCGEMVKFGTERQHVCRRNRPPELLGRWYDDRVARETIREADRLDCDPAFAPGKEVIPFGLDD